MMMYDDDDCDDDDDDDDADDDGDHDDVDGDDEPIDNQHVVAAGRRRQWQCTVDVTPSTPTQHQNHAHT